MAGRVIVLALLLALALPLLAPPAVGAQREDHWAGVTTFRAHDSYRVTSTCRDVRTTFVLALAESGQGSALATYSAGSEDCLSQTAPHSQPYSEAAALAVPDPRTGRALFEFSSDHFTPDGSGGWINHVTYANGDIATTRISVFGEYEFDYLFANGSGYGFRGILTGAPAALLTGGSSQLA